MGDAIYTKAERERMEREEERASHVKQKHVAPAEEQQALIKLGDATRMLAEVRDAPGAKNLMDLAAAAEVYARKAKLGEEAVRYAGGIKLDAERRLGEYLKQTPKAPAGRPKEIGSTPELISDRPATLAELGIPRKLAAEAQRLASIDDETFAKVKAGEMKPAVAFRDQKRAAMPPSVEPSKSVNNENPDSLSAQKRRVLELAAGGMRYSDIAIAVGVRSATVRKWVDDPESTPSEANGGGTPRRIEDAEVARLFADGMSVNDIARELNASRGTIGTYLKRLGLGRSGKRVQNPLIDHISRAESQAEAWTVGADTVATAALVSSPSQINELIKALGQLSRAATNLKNRLNKDVGKDKVDG